VDVSNNALQLLRYLKRATPFARFVGHIRQNRFSFGKLAVYQFAALFLRWTIAKTNLATRSPKIQAQIRGLVRGNDNKYLFQKEHKQSLTRYDPN
jgi:hypothetical protein